MKTTDEKGTALELHDLVLHYWWRFAPASYLAKRVMAGADEAAYPLAVAVQALEHDLDAIREAKGIE